MMGPTLTACERCGLREVSHELEKKGVIIRFCDECYWGEISEPDAEARAETPPAGQPFRLAEKRAS
jgi:hypothetical protein